MAFRTKKISQMDPKGSNLASTDLLEISQLVSGSYVTKSITGAQIAASAPAAAWGTITGTLSSQTDLNTALSGKVPTTRTLTINGTTQDLSADRTFTISTGITIGTTAITSGTVGRVLFQGTGNVVQQSANLFWDLTNNRLGIGTSSPISKMQVITDNATSPFAFSSQTSQIAGTTTAGVFSAYSLTNGGYLNCGNPDVGWVNMTYLAGRHIFSLAGTEAMRITGGNVLINTTTDAGFKLDVNGTARVQGDATINTLKIGLGGGAIGSNTAIGLQALNGNTTGVRNVALGQQANFTNSTGGDNTAIGYQALYLNVANHNTAVGSNALYSNTGNHNSGFGRNSLVSNTSGAQNTGIGRDALSANTTGSDNSALGYQTASGNFSGSTILGRGATATANNQFVVGSTGTVAGAVTTEVNASTQVWNVIINGVARKILLA